MSSTARNQDIYMFIRSVSKKFFAWATTFYFLLLFIDILTNGAVSDRIRLDAVLGLMLVGLVFMTLFSHHQHNKRISLADWGLIFVLALITIGMNVFRFIEGGIIRIIGASVLLLLAGGLAVYLWTGRDKHVQFNLFSHDRRLKFSTYLKHTLQHWLVSGFVVIFLLTVFYLGHRPAAVTQPPDIIAEATPTPIITTETTPEATPTSPPATATPAPTPTPTPVPELPEGYQLFILNGSGIPGAATTIRDRLRENNLSVFYVGDANHFGYEETYIKYNAQFKTVADVIFDTLQPFYDPLILEEFREGELYSQYDIVVIHGG